MGTRDRQNSDEPADRMEFLERRRGPLRIRVIKCRKSAQICVRGVLATLIDDALEREFQLSTSNLGKLAQVDQIKTQHSRWSSRLKTKFKGKFLTQRNTRSV